MPRSDRPPTAAPGTEWSPDILGDGFTCTTVDLGDDPDGEAPVVATVIRHRPAARPDGQRAAVLYVHGFTDYFFQAPLAEAFAAAGFDFFAVDLRKCGRSRRPGHTPHHITDLATYDVELNAALDLVDAETDGAAVVVAGHSTGGLITPLWLDRLRRTDPVRHDRVTGLVLNSPWFDLQGAPALRSWGTWLAHAVARIAPTRPLPQRLPGGYGESLHASAHGEWEYDLDLKPLGGFPVTFGFLSAVRSGHAALHRGVDVGVPSLVLRSDRSVLGGPYRTEIDTVDAVLDVEQIARWSGCVGDRVTVVPVAGARHDVFLSRTPARDVAYTELSSWLASATPTLSARRTVRAPAAGSDPPGVIS